MRFPILLCACGALALAQFEAASIKPAAPDARGMRCTGGPGTTNPGTLTCDNYSLSLLTMMAYDLRGFQFSGPGWMDSAHFNVAAKIPAGANRREFDAMLQKLLAERFGLRVHFEKKSVAGYALTVAKGGSKLTESHEPETAKPEAPWRAPAGGPPGRTMARLNRKGDTAAEIAAFLSNLLGAPVTDATGLKGRYDYAISFMMEPGGHAAGPDASVDSQPDTSANLIDALREQLGLRLEKSKADVNVLVVDHAERNPTDN